MRLFLVGDDEALDIIADLSRHLDYFEVSRTDELPALGADDHVIIGLADAARSLELLARLLAATSPAFATVLSPAGSDSTGARAILAAAQLVTALQERTR
jgi:hypothetical protein